MSLMITDDEIRLTAKNWQIHVYKFDKVEPDAIQIAAGVKVNGADLEFADKSVALADINAVFESHYSTYLLADGLYYVTDAFDGAAERITEYCPHLIEFNDTTFIDKDEITDFLVDVRTVNGMYTINAVVDICLIPVDDERNFMDAVKKRDGLCAKYLRSDKDVD